MPPAMSAEERARYEAFNKAVGQNIRRALTRARITASAVADDLKMSRSMMSLYLSGKRRASTEILCAIASRLGLNASELLPDSREPEGEELQAAPPPSCEEANDLPDGLARYLRGREDRISPAVVRQLKTSRFGYVEGVALDDVFWDGLRRVWERKLSPPPVGSAELPGQG